MKVFLINILFFSSKILCLHIFILYIFSITGQSCHLPNHLNLQPPKERTYYMMYVYHSQFMFFLLSASSAQSAFEFSAFKYIFWYYPQQFSLSHWLKLYPLKCRIWWAPNNASKGQMGFNWAFKGLNVYIMTWFC